MPNWVSNSVRVTGSREDLRSFAEQAGRTYKRRYQDITPDGVVWVDGESNEELSFWNFVKPEDSILDEYWGKQPNPASLEEALKHESNPGMTGTFATGIVSGMPAMSTSRTGVATS